MLQINDTALLRALARFRPDGSPVNPHEPFRRAVAVQRDAAIWQALRTLFGRGLRAIAGPLHPPAPPTGQVSN